MDALRKLMGLATSRKLALATLVLTLDWANRRFALGMPPELLGYFAALIAVVIIGISVEDAAGILKGSGRFAPPTPADPATPPRPPQDPPAAARGAALAVFFGIWIFAIAGCVMHQRDQRTIDTLTWAIAAKEDQWRRTQNELAATGATPSGDLEMLHRSYQDRLRAAKLREESKAAR